MVETVASSEFPEEIHCELRKITKCAQSLEYARMMLRNWRVSGFGWILIANSESYAQSQHLRRPRIAQAHPLACLIQGRHSANFNERT